jgi:WS/DGAT/MGAT family acyltransferase
MISTEVCATGAPKEPAPHATVLLSCSPEIAGGGGTAMKHLSGMDATFFHVETPETPMHVGSLCLASLPEGYEGDFYEDYKTQLGSRLHLAEVFERKLALMPFELSNPIWVDDDDVDLDYHVRRIILSKPGTFEQLEQYVARLHSSLMDRSRPLWEIYVIEGLKDGQVAIYSKVHHAAVDGQAGVALVKALYDISPEPRPVKPRREKSRAESYQLGAAELAMAAIKNTAEQYIKMITTLPNTWQAITSLSLPKISEALPNIGPNTDWGLAPRTPLNVSITNQRSYAARSVSLADVKQTAKRLNVTLNDIVLAACAQALRQYLADDNALPKAPLLAAVPVSLREAGNTEQNNQVSIMLVSLATDIADPLERLRAINQSSASSKEITGSLKAVIPTDYPSFGAPWLMSGLATLLGRSKIADNLPPLANVTISNVPGPQVPLYMAGAKVNTYFPVSIPAHSMALNMTVQSYNGMLDYGLIGCRRAVPNIGELADYVVDAHRQLDELAAGQDSAAPPPVSAPAEQRKPEAAARPSPARKVEISTPGSKAGQ